MDVAGARNGQGWCVTPAAPEREEDRNGYRWNRYYNQQLQDPDMKKLVIEELAALEVGIQIARLREKLGSAPAVVISFLAFLSSSA